MDVHEIVRYRVNWWRITVAIMFYVHQNDYFGWNARPLSIAELFADAVVFFLLSISFKKEISYGTTQP